MPEGVNINPSDMLPPEMNPHQPKPVNFSGGVFEPSQQITESQKQNTKNVSVIDKKELSVLKRKIKKLEDELDALKSITDFKYSNIKYKIETDEFQGTSNNSIYLLDIILKELKRSAKYIKIDKV